TAERRPTTTRLTGVNRASFTPRRRPEIRVEAADIAAKIGDPGTVIVDARDNGQYSGAVRRGPRGGHIPTAVNIPAKSLMNADGTWKPNDELRQILADGGVKPNQHVIAYCNGGVT